jgi:hypothetical protein
MIDESLEVRRDPTKGETHMSYEDDVRIPWGKVILVVVLLVVLGLGLDWLSAGENFFLYKYWAPKNAAVQRQVFEQTPSYVKGMVQELSNMQFQYEQADDSHKAALADLILHRAAGFNLNDPDVPADLRSFIQQLKDDRKNAR